MRMAETDDRLLMLIEDEPAQGRLIGTLVAREGWCTKVVTGLDHAVSMLGSDEGGKVTAVLLDHRIPGDGTCDLISRLRAMRPALPILMLTANDNPAMAVEAMRAGATDYLIKPVAPARLLGALRSATAEEAPGEELQPLAEKIPPTLDFDAMIGTASNFRAAIAKAAKAARSHNHVLVAGERGTGKEMLLRAIQSASPRARAPVRLINARGVTGSAIESALFGHEANAFPGAFERQIGALQHCDGGTLILDEIDRLQPEVQDKLAEVLASGVVRPLGARHGFRVDVRILAATNAVLPEDEEADFFQPALFKAISQTRIPMPPLRERSSDIPGLARHFLAVIGGRPGMRHLSITDGALTMLAAYDWPGNVRQLQAVLFRAAVFCDKQTLTARSFPQISAMFGDLDHDTSRAQEAAGITLYTEDGNLRPLEEIEADVIRLAIGHYRGRMSEVARRLGIGRSTLYRKLVDLGIDNAA